MGSEMCIRYRGRHGHERVKRAFGVLERFLRLCRQKASGRKSYAFGTTPLQRDGLADAKLFDEQVPLKSAARVTGAHFSFDRAAHRGCHTDRLTAGTGRARRLGQAPLPLTARQEMLATAALPQGLFGAEVAALPAADLERFRTAVLHA